MKRVFGPLAALLLLPMAAAAETSTTQITLASYNLHVGVPMGESIGQYKSEAKDLDELAKAIAELDADIVALQEVDCEYGLANPARRRSSLLNQARYLAAMGKYSYVFGSAQDDTGYPTDNPRYTEWGTADRWTNNGGDHGEVGNALLSRFAIKGKPENIPLPKDEGQERRACIRAELELPPVSGETSRTIVVYATHLQHNSGATRYKQMKAILDRIQTEPEGTLVFLAGDLNHEPDPEEKENPINLALESGLHDLTAPPAGAKPAEHATYPADKPEIRIDFVFANQPLRVVKKQILPSQASDHLPVAVTVELP